MFNVFLGVYANHFDCFGANWVESDDGVAAFHVDKAVVCGIDFFDEFPCCFW